MHNRDYSRLLVLKSSLLRPVKLEQRLIRCQTRNMDYHRLLLGLRSFLLNRAKSGPHLIPCLTPALHHLLRPFSNMSLHHHRQSIPLNTVMH